MAQATISQMVHARAPWLGDTEADEAKITLAFQDQCTVLQPYTLLSDEDVDEEQLYTRLQRLLLATLTAYQLLVGRATETVGGVNGVLPQVPRVVTKAKADVVETEFTIVKGSDVASLTLNTDKLLAELRAAACGLAQQLGYPLPLCGAIEPTNDYIPFITVLDSDYYG